MPIRLKTNFNPGDNDKDSPEGYPYCQVLNFIQNSITFGVMIEYSFGFCTGSYLEHWSKGKGSPIKTLEVDPVSVAKMWGQYPQEGETVGQAMRRLTYSFLIESGVVDGTIENNPPLPPEQIKAADASEKPAEPSAETSEPVTDAPAEPEAPAEDKIDSGQENDVAPNQAAGDAADEQPVEEPVPSPS